MSGDIVFLSDGTVLWTGHQLFGKEMTLGLCWQIPLPLHFLWHQLCHECVGLIVVSAATGFRSDSAAAASDAVERETDVKGWPISRSQRTRLKSRRRGRRQASPKAKATEEEGVKERGGEEGVVVRLWRRPSSVTPSRPAPHLTPPITAVICSSYLDSHLFRAENCKIKGAQTDILPGAWCSLIHPGLFLHLLHRQLHVSSLRHNPFPPLQQQPYARLLCIRAFTAISVSPSTRPVAASTSTSPMHDNRCLRCCVQDRHRCSSNT